MRRRRNRPFIKEDTQATQPGRAELPTHARGLGGDHTERGNAGSNGRFPLSRGSRSWGAPCSVATVRTPQPRRLPCAIRRPLEWAKTNPAPAALTGCPSSRQHSRQHRPAHPQPKPCPSHPIPSPLPGSAGHASKQQSFTGQVPGGHTYGIRALPAFWIPTQSMTQA